MASLASISLSGMTAAQASLGVAANNIANAQTGGYRRQLVQQSAQASGGVSTTITKAEEAGSSIEADMVGLLQAKNSFLANLALFEAGDRVMGSLLDVAG